MSLSAAYEKTKSPKLTLVNSGRKRSANACHDSPMPLSLSRPVKNAAAASRSVVRMRTAAASRLPDSRTLESARYASCSARQCSAGLRASRSTVTLLGEQKQRAIPSVGRGPLRVEDAGLVDALVGVGAEEIALALDQVGRQPLLAIGVEVVQRRAQRRAGHSQRAGDAHGLA